MRVLLVGNSEKAGNLAGALAGTDLAVDRHPDGATHADGADEVDQIARDLRELERVLGENRPDAVLVASASNTALAAALVATKLEVPLLRLELPGEHSSGRNADLIDQLADASLAPEAAAIVDWVRDTYTPRA